MSLPLNWAEEIKGLDPVLIDLISEFSSTACKALYKCDDCLEPFEHFKCI